MTCSAADGKSVPNPDSTDHVSSTARSLDYVPRLFAASKRPSSSLLTVLYLYVPGLAASLSGFGNLKKYLRAFLS